MENAKHHLFPWIVVVAAALLAVGTLALPWSSAMRFALSSGRGPGASFVPAQTDLPVRDLAAGRFLVANRDSRDPNFAETVVLLARYERQSVMGLIVNRPTKIPLSRLFQESRQARDRDDPVYVGGPVAVGGVLALLRSRSEPAEASRVLDDVYLISTKEPLEEAIEAGTGSSALRVYLGYSGWAPGQLEREVELGAWHIFEGDARTVFDPDPGSLWLRYIRRTELQIAMAPRAFTFIHVH